MQSAYNETTMPAPSLVTQTVYAELLERCASAAFSSAFPDDGVFTSKTIKGRKYWYFQLSSSEGRTQRYVGPETPELLKRIESHKNARDDERERRALVSTLVRSFGLSRPIQEIGAIIAALAKAGVFRLRGVLVGTVAYQTYPAMLGAKFPLPMLQTGDIDIAQFKNVSIAIEDHTPPVLEILKDIDRTFRAVPTIHDGGRTTSYQAKGGLRVDFLTPNEGPDTDEPQPLPAFHTDAQPLKFLDFLIYESQPAVVLHDAGVYVTVPSPQRYVIHKLIISRRRKEGTAKRDKDIQQAEALLNVLTEKRSFELKAAWDEALNRGPKWKELLLQGVVQLTAQTRDTTLRTVDGRRSMMPGLDLSFNNPPARYDFDRDIVEFVGEAMGSTVHCAISREALDDHFGTDNRDNQGRVERFMEKRSEIENLARIKYLSWPIEEAGAVLVKTTDVPKLLQSLTATTSS
jgi:hypothetical protein